VRRRVLGRPSCGRLLERIGEVRLKLDQYGRAEAALVDAVSLLSAAHGSEHLSVAKAQTTLGELRLKQARFDEAQVLLATSLDKKEAAMRQQRKTAGGGGGDGDGDSGGGGDNGGRGAGGDSSGVGGSGGDVAAMNKSEQLLGELAHKRGALGDARALFERVIAARTAEVPTCRAPTDLNPAAEPVRLKTPQRALRGCSAASARSSFPPVLMRMR